MIFNATFVNAEIGSSVLELTNNLERFHVTDYGSVLPSICREISQLFDIFQTKTSSGLASLKRLF